MKLRRPGTVAAGLIAAVLALAVISVCLVYFLNTERFRSLSRERIIAEIGRVTGSTVELGSFNLNWKTSTAVLTNLVIHGTEPPETPPLFRVSSLRIELNWRSFLSRQFDARRVDASEPELHLLINPDGSTNLPKIATQAGSVLNRFFDLHVNRYDLSQGKFVVNREERAFSIHGENLDASLRAVENAAAYSFHIVTPGLKIKARCCREWPLEVTAAGTVQADFLRFDSLRLSGKEVTLAASGALRNFVRPVGEFTYQAQTSAAVLSSVADAPGLRNGDFTMEGKAHFERPTGLTLSGKLHVRDLIYSSGNARLANASADGDFEFANSVMRIQALRARLLGGTFTGEATLHDFHFSSLAGQLAHIESGSVTSAAGVGPLPFKALLGGPVSLSASDGLRGEMTLQPLGDPAHRLVGRISLHARSPADFGFDASHLDLSRTHLDFQGSPRQGFDLTLSSNDLEELRPVLAWLNIETDPNLALPELLPEGKAQFDGTVRGSLKNPAIDGMLRLSKFRSHGGSWDRLLWRGHASRDSLSATGFSLESTQTHISGSGSLALHQWQATTDGQLRLNAGFRGIDLAPYLDSNPILSKATAEGTIDVSGSLQNPAGKGRLRLTNIVLYGEQIPRVRADLSLAGSALHISHGILGDRRGNELSFNGDYVHSIAGWRTGEYKGVFNSKRFELAHLTLARKYAPDVNGLLAADVTLAAQISPAGIKPVEGRGTLSVHDLSLSGETIGNVQAQLETRAARLELKLAGDVQGNSFSGETGVQLGGADPIREPRTTDSPGTAKSAEVPLSFGAAPGGLCAIRGSFEFGRVPLNLLRNLFLGSRFRDLETTGFASGNIEFQGSLDSAQPWHASVRLSELEASRHGKFDTFVVRNAAPVAFEFGDGRLHIQSFRLRGPDTEADINGSVDYHLARTVNLNVNGSVSLQLLSMLDPGLEANGTAGMHASVRGTLGAPLLAGDLRIVNGSILPAGFSNGLSKLNGTLTFDQDRATIRTLTAEAGGGQLSLGGFISFTGPSPLSYHVEARAQNTRLRSDSGISATADASLRLTGDSTNSLLSGNISVSRVVFTPNTDVGNLLSSFAAPAPGGQSKILSSMQMDLSIQSTPNLQVNTALSRDMGADVRLRLRGSPDHPVLLGSISANQGDVRVFGTRYTITRGEVSFLNPATIDPVLDLDLQTEARGINVDITISGTLDRLNVNYRSDPPLQPRDIIALLAVGRTPQEAANVQSSQVAASDATALQASASSVLGQAISPPSNRLSKLFGVTNIKLDPLVQGITSTPQSRLTLEQQISRAITITYVTNLEQTSEQIFRLEWSINREYSVVAVRDDNGEFGIDFQYKRRFK